MIRILIFTLGIVPQLAWTQSSSSPAQTVNAAGNVMSAVVGNARAKQALDAHLQTIIGGTCVYKSAACTGAKVVLKNSKGEILQQAIATSEGFKFGGLNEKSYTVEIDYKKYKLKSTTPDVTPGRMIEINFDTDHSKK